MHVLKEIPFQDAYNMQVLCPCYVRRHIKVMLCGQMCRYLLKIGAQ